MKFLINWFDIPAVDIERAVKFYNNIFNFTLEVLDCGNEKMACFPEINGLSGAISQSEGFMPSKNGIQVTFDGGEDLSETLDKVVEYGGEVVKGKTKIEAEGRGFFALICDSEGNTIGLYSDK